MVAREFFPPGTVSQCHKLSTILGRALLEISTLLDKNAGMNIKLSAKTKQMIKTAIFFMLHFMRQEGKIKALLLFVALIIFNRSILSLPSSNIRLFAVGLVP